MFEILWVYNYGNLATPLHHLTVEFYHHPLPSRTRSKSLPLLPEPWHQWTKLFKHWVFTKNLGSQTTWTWVSIHEVYQAEWAESYNYFSLTSKICHFLQIEADKKPQAICRLLQKVLFPIYCFISTLNSLYLALLKNS